MGLHQRRHDGLDRPNPTYTYTTRGVYTAKLTVKDSSGAQDIKSTVITVGNTSATITIEVPKDGDFFDWGQTIPYKVTVTDPEDGPIDCSRVKVTFVLVHDQHGHAEDETTGCTGWLETLAEDASHGGYIAGGISVSYTDKGGDGVPALTATKQHVVQAKRQQVEYTQNESGTTVATVPAGEVDPGGGQVRNALDPGDYIAINNKIDLSNMNKSITLRFGGGSATNVAGADRALVEFRLDSPTGTLAGTGTLKSTGVNNNTFTSQTFPLNFTGAHQLFLVFRAVAVTGAPATAFGNLNWVEFSGAGVGLAPDFFPQVPGTVGGTVPATLSLTLGAPAAFGAFTPGVAGDYRRRPRRP